MLLIYYPTKKYYQKENISGIRDSLPLIKILGQDRTIGFNPDSDKNQDITKIRLLAIPKIFYMRIIDK